MCQRRVAAKKKKEEINLKLMKKNGGKGQVTFENRRTENHEAEAIRVEMLKDMIVPI